MKPKLPYCTQYGVHIFVEDVMLAALDLDEECFKWRKTLAEGSRYRQFHSMVARDWVAGRTLVEISKYRKVASKTVSNQIERIRRRAESRAGHGAQPLFNAIISEQLNV